mmetsp:Transcript_19848/g.50873  ORF Transcript_19848/g.50873 Transcript_19848/m.50873 type:complete len:80 (+) Transcript_19848:298-537(+)
MPFVYQGAGKRQSQDADICQVKCKKQNADIQWCLSRNNYQQQKCQDFVDNWTHCCMHARAQEREPASRNLSEQQGRASN